MQDILKRSTNRRKAVLGAAVGLGAASSNLTWRSVNTARAQDNVKLQITVWLGDGEYQAIQELGAVHTESHPNVELEFVNIVDGGPWGRDQLQRMIAGGSAPDIMMMNTGQFESFGSRGALANLDERVADSGFDLGIYWPAAVEGCKIDGSVYGLPKDISNHIVYINTEFFEEAGVDIPENEWDWNDYLEVCKALTRDSDGDGQIDRWGTAIENSSWAWGGFVYSNGGEVLNAERTECLLNSEASTEALEYYFAPITRDESAVPPGALPQLEGAGDQFLGGVIGMHMAGPWFRPGLVENELFPWTARLFPRAPEGEAPTSILYVDQWAMSATTNHPDEAWELLQFLGGPDGHNAWAEIYGSRSINPIEEIARSDQWLNYGGDEHRVDNELILEQLDRTVPPLTNFGQGATVENIWNDQLGLVIVGQMDVPTATQTITDMVNAELGM